MGHRDIYSSGLSKDQFLFFEIRVVARLYLEGLDEDGIHDLVMEKNLLQFPTERSIKRTTSTCLRRIKLLGNSDLVDLLANAPADVGKQVNLYAMMCDNKIVWDFMTTVIGEKFRIRDLSFGERDINLFFFRLQEQSDVAAKWNDTTVKKLKQVLVNCLNETSFLTKNKDSELVPVLLYDEVEKGIRASGDLVALSAFNCFR